jgi:hypothetical protein
MVTVGYTVLEENVLVYSAGDPKWGHHAHVVTLDDGHGQVWTVANTHMRWGAPGTPPEQHLGVANARELTASVESRPVAVIAADTNDRPNGPAKEALLTAGYRFVHGDEPTAIPNDKEPISIDVIAARGATCMPVPTGVALEKPMPRRECPSDHVPLLADLVVRRAADR